MPSNWSIYPTDTFSVATNDTTISQITSGLSLGDCESIELFYNQYFNCMYSEAYRCSGRDESFCLDVVQEATLKALRCIRVMTSEQHLRSWVKLVVRSVVYDLFRQETRRQQREKRHVTQSDSTVDSAELDRMARLIWLEDQLNALDGESAELMRMRYRLGWTLARIGTALGINTGTVDGRIQRLIQQLKHKAENACDDQ